MGTDQSHTHTELGLKVLHCTNWVWDQSPTLYTLGLESESQTDLANGSCMTCRDQEQFTLKHPYFRQASTTEQEPPSNTSLQYKQDELHMTRAFRSAWWSRDKYKVAIHKLAIHFLLDYFTSILHKRLSSNWQHPIIRSMFYIPQSFMLAHVQCFEEL